MKYENSSIFLLDKKNSLFIKIADGILIYGLNKWN